LIACRFNNIVTKAKIMKKELVLFIFLLICLSSCVKNDLSFLDESNCQAPCWRQIRVGESNREDTVKLLKAMEDIQLESIQNTTGNGYKTDGLIWNFDGPQEAHGAIYFHDDKVVYIWLSTPNGTMLKDLFDRLGSPNQLIVSKSVLDGVMVTIGFMYPERGFCFYSRRSMLKVPDYFSIKSDFKIDEILFFDPKLSSDAVNASCYQPFSPNDLQHWNGFGKYKIFPLSN
jgi:hypothetical protein